MGRLPKRSILGCVILVALIGAIVYAWSKSSKPKATPPATAAGESAARLGAVSRPTLNFILSADGLPAKGMWKSTPMFADIKKDGKLDLAAIPRLGDGAHVWFGDGTGKWTDTSAGLQMDTSCGGGVALGDIRNSGHLDLVVADHCRGVFVYSGDGAGHWQAMVEKLNPAISTPKSSENDNEALGFYKGSEDLAVGDVNEDGFLDIVAASSDQGGLTVYLGDGTGILWQEARSTGLPNGEEKEPEDENNGGWANQVRLVDINNDGHLDVVAAYFAGPRVWLGDGKGHFRYASRGLPEPTLGGLYRGIAVGDINEDGLPDLVMASEVNGPEVYLQQADGSWLALPDVLPSLKGGAVAVALGDLTGEGHLDLVVSGRGEKSLGSDYGLFVLKGDGKGGFKEIETNLPTTGLSVAWGVAIADVNNDGLPDVAVCTGGAVPGKEQGRPQSVRLNSAKPRKETVKPKPKPEVVEELPLPRLQVWLNKGGG